MAELFKIDFPEGKDFSTHHFDTMVANFLKDGKKSGLEDAFFLMRLDEMARSVEKKEEFKAQVFSFFEKAYGLNTTTPTQDSHVEQQPQ